MQKSQRYKRKIQSEREAWRASVPRKCMLCGTDRHWLGFQIHEMLRKGQSANDWAYDWNYLLLCEPCHRDRIPFLTHAQQLGVKWERDNANFDLEAFLRTRNPKAMDYVTMGEVLTAAYWFRKTGDPRPQKGEAMDNDELITVCDKCLQASCWQGIFMCQESQTAGIVEKSRKELEELALEHPDYWEMEA